MGKATSGCSCKAEAPVHVAQDRLCDDVCGKLAVCCSATSRAALRFSLSLWLTYLMRSKQEWWMSLTGGSFESQEELSSYSSLSWSLMMFQMAAVPSAHVPEWGWWQLRAEPPQGWRTCDSDVNEQEPLCVNCADLGQCLSPPHHLAYSAVNFA